MRARERQNRNRLIGPRDFLYTVVSDYGTVDDNGQITRPHGRYRPCPTAEESKPAPIAIDLEKADKIIKALPKAEIKMPSLGGVGQADMAGGSSNPALPSLSRDGSSNAQSSGATSSASSSPFVASSYNEKDWRSDRPPKAWPKFPPDNPLSKPGTKVSVKDAMASAARVEDRWYRYEASKTGTRPSVDEIEDALRMLLTIEEGSADFPQAWAAFVRLRKIQQIAIERTAVR